MWSLKELGFQASSSTPLSLTLGWGSSDKIMPTIIIVGFDAFVFSSYIISVPLYLHVNSNYLSHCCGNSKLYLFWCNISKNKVNSSMFSICNPHFGTIENVIVSLLFSFCFQGKSITSWAYFWQAKTSNLKIKYTHIIIKSSSVGQRKIRVQIYQLILKSKISLIWARKFQT